MKRNFHTLAIVFLAAVSAACAAASPRPVAVPATLDRNGDGQVSFDEFAAFMGQNPSARGPDLFERESDLFARIDADKSGTISRDEWKRFDMSPEAAEDFDALDTNHDNQISADEWHHNLGTSRVIVHLFQHLDANRDGFLSNDELQRSPLAPILSISF